MLGHKHNVYAIGWSWLNHVMCETTGPVQSDKTAGDVQRHNLEASGNGIGKWLISLPHYIPVCPKATCVVMVAKPVITSYAYKTNDSDHDKCAQGLIRLVLLITSVLAAVYRLLKVNNQCVNLRCHIPVQCLPSIGEISITKCVLLYKQLSPPGLHSIHIKFRLVSVYQLGYKMQFKCVTV